MSYKNFLKRNRSHYLKWLLDDKNDMSIRYYFTFESKKFKKYEGKWVLKSHQNKTYEILSEEDAAKIIKEQATHEDPQELFSMSGENYEYIRLIIDENCKPEILELEEEFD